MAQRYKIMTNYEILRLHKDFLATLDAMGIRASDHHYITLYEEYSAMKDKGLKTSYIVAYLSERHHVCERTVYAVIKRLQRPCIVS